MIRSAGSAVDLSCPEEIDPSAALHTADEMCGADV